MDFRSSLSISKNLGVQAYEALREAILTLQLEPGQIIYESTIASDLKISRTPIRDACQTLIGEGLIEVSPQRQKKIASISETKVKESGFVRFSLESSAFQFVIRNWQNSELHQAVEKQIHQILQEQHNAAQQQDIVMFLQLDEAFHRCILQLSKNETLLGVIYHMRGHLNRFRYLAMKELDLTQGVIEEHEQLFTYLKEGNEQQTIQLLEQHLTKFDAEIPRLRQTFPTYFSD